MKREVENSEEELSFKRFFVPLTTSKALHLLVILGMLILSNGFFNGFVSDDNTIIINNPAVHSIANIPSIFLENRYDNDGQTFLGGKYYRPITDSFFAVNYGIWGLNAFPFHFFQILLFIINACLLFLILIHFFSKPISFALSLIFLLHPINSENAFYISSVQEVLFLLFGMLAMLIVLKKDSHKTLIIVSVCLLLSLLSKETGILFSIIVLLYIYLYKKKNFLTLLGYTTITIAIYLVMRLLVLGNPIEVGAHSPMERLDLIQRLMQIPSIAFYYLKTFFYPLDLATSYQWVITTMSISHFYLPLLLSLIVLLVLLCIGICIYRSQSRNEFRMYTYFFIWFCLGMGLHLQIYPLDQTVAERWFYFPIIGMLGMIGSLVMTWKHKVFSQWIVITFVILLSLLGTRIFFRSFDFRNDKTLVLSDIKVSKDSYSLEYMLSGIYLNEGKFELAQEHAERSTLLFPTLANYNNLGVVYMQTGKYDLAHKSFATSLIYGEDYLPYDNLANLALVYGKPKENIHYLKNTILKKYPENGNAWLTLSILEYIHGDKAHAKHAIQQARLYSTAPQVPFIADVISTDKPLQLHIMNGQVSFETNE